jgi:methionine-rich copper-binding protein CopC
MVQLKATGLKDVNGTLLDPVLAFYFKTAATTYANTTLDSVLDDTIASGTDQTITLNFSAPVKETPETGSSVTITKNEDITKTLDSDSDDISLAYGADNTEVVLTIHADITPGTYEVSVNNGLWLDKNDNPIEVQTLTFTVE